MLQNLAELDENTLGLVYKEFGYNELLVVTSRFLCIKRHSFIYHFLLAGNSVAPLNSSIVLFDYPNCIVYMC